MIRRRGAGAHLLLALALLAPGPDARTQESPRPRLEVLEFMAGCWRGEFGRDGVIEEAYMRPAGGLMLGTTRFLRNGRAVQHEFARIVEDSAGVFLRPFPGGSPSPARFRLTAADGRTAVFEAPEHDFPKRIVYRENADGTHTARVDGGEGSEESQEWVMRPVGCR
ncbi:MAG: hypothetical protein GWO00_01565 [Gemmatimonadetes bacterium]|nr:hypothetical protein [Gemmatimonadota bacterium]